MNPQEAGLHYQILGITPEASLLEVKKAYRILAHRYHPDKSAPERLHQNTRIMTRLNEAYRRACKEAIKKQKNAAHQAMNAKSKSAPAPSPPPAAPKRRQAQTPPASGHANADHSAPGANLGSQQKAPQEKSPALPKDPAYSLYKQGHIYFHRGFYKFYRKKEHIENKLAAALEIIANFQKAYEYYNRVIEEHPESPWRADAAYKIQKIKKLTPIYHKIFERLRELNEEELKKIKAWEEISRRNGFCSVKDLERTFLHIWEVKKI